MWLQEMTLPCEQDPVLGREQGVSLSSFKVNFEILHYMWLHHVIEFYRVYVT
jgi:hypothetical protein